MDGIAHILSPYTAPWNGWTLLVLFLCAILSEWFQPGVITQAYTSLSSRNDRTYKEAPVNFIGQFLITIFRIGTLSMALCICLCAPDKAPYAAFWIICGLIIGVIILQVLCNRLLDYTFMLSRRFGNVYEHLGNIVTMAAMVLFPSLLILIRIPNIMVIRWTVTIIVLTFIILWCYRCARTFLTSLISFWYLILYIMTVVMLPMIALVYLSEKTIAII